MMNFHKILQTRKGGLIRLKTQLYWYGGRGWDGNPGRICLLLGGGVTAALARTKTAATRGSTSGEHHAVTAHLLIDGSPHWVWVVQEDVELL